MSGDHIDPIFSDSKVIFSISQSDSFTIQPLYYLDFKDDDSPFSKLLRADCELRIGDRINVAGDYFFLQSFIALRDYLARIHWLRNGETLELRTEEDVLVMTFTRQKTIVSVSGRTPDDGYTKMMIRDYEKYLETNIDSQLIFRFNFPLSKVSEVVNQMNSILDVIDNLKE
ncbi:hypothetical protein Enr10x_30340 [Gimesia panareensis]|uniref:Uncharacterized protein n=1 Tax=Gimesia panareensis TaxID=2527978 RepID=A0A517Q7V8_9PLAN|nr:hypothetical protein [Gimesia panareensis]QDT27714.1 hypothetical protein Enr10x_30340 [Gimesia panareensis]